jgi:hypothetical protein
MRRAAMDMARAVVIQDAVPATATLTPGRPRPPRSMRGPGSGTPVARPNAACVKDGRECRARAMTRPGDMPARPPSAIGCT